MTSTMGGAFGGSAASKAKIVQRLQAHFDAGDQISAPGLRWSQAEMKGTLMGLTAHADTDAVRYEEAVGWPAALGATHEALFTTAQAERVKPDEPTAPALTTAEWVLPHLTAWLQCIWPGSNLDSAVPVFQRRLAAALLDGLPVVGALPDRVRQMVMDWHGLLDHHLSGRATTPNEWELLRKACGEAQPEEPGASAVLALIEAVAWPSDESVVEWPGAWTDFLRMISRVGMERELDPELASVNAQATAAWLELERRDVSEPDFDMFAESERNPAIRAANEPGVRAQLDDAAIRNARPLIERLFAELVAAIEDCETRPFPANPAAEAKFGEPDASKAAVDVPAGAFDTEVLRAKGLVFVDFWAPWCAPCVQFAPTLEALARTYAARIKFVKVNVDEQGEVADSQGVRGLPTLLLYEDGQIVERIMALNRSRIAAVLDRRLA